MESEADTYAFNTIAKLPSACLIFIQHSHTHVARGAWDGSAAPAIGHTVPDFRSPGTCLS